MPFIKNTITNAGAFATAFLGATFAAHAGVSSEVVNSYPVAAPILVVLSNVLSNISSECINPLKEEILEQFKNKNPNQLNHDIQKALIKSMEEAVKGIKILYDDKNPNRPLSSEAKKFLKNFNDEFITNFSPSAGYIIKEDELKSILHADNKNQDELFIHKQLNACLEKGFKSQIINVELKNLFAEKFIPLTQFYFGEELKNSKNPAPRRAMERMLSEETLAGINKLIALQENSDQDIQSLKWLGKVGKLSQNKVDKLKSLVEEFNNPKKLEVQYGEALDKRFEDLYIQYKDLQFDITKINTVLKDIHTILVRYLMAASVLVIASVVTASVIVTKNNFQPFDATIMLVKDSTITVSNEYPQSLQRGSSLSISLQKPKSQEVLTNLQVEFSDISRIYLNHPVFVKLNDAFWETSIDTIILRNCTINLPIRPNKTYAKIEGNLKTSDGQHFVSNAKIIVDGETTYTDSNGNFTLLMPIPKRKKNYTIRFEKNGYRSFEKEYTPGTPLITRTLN